MDNTVVLSFLKYVLMIEAILYHCLFYGISISERHEPWVRIKILPLVILTICKLQ